MGHEQVFEFTGTDRYEVLERLGSGGMGTVYAAFDRTTKTNVALKLLHRQHRDSLELFKREFRNLQDIEHRNLISLGELREDDGDWFFTMELLRGKNFKDYVRAGAHVVTELGESPPTVLARSSAMSMLFGGKMKRVSNMEVPRSNRRHFHEQRLRDAVAQLACGLAVLHRAHKVHRDIKPSNIIVESDGRLVLLDFGIAMDLHARTHQPGERVIGTAVYMAPEQIDPSATQPASDCYALGVLMYEALTGTRPFSSVAADNILTYKREALPVPASRLAQSIPDDLERLCMDLLAIEPNDRPTAEDVLRRLSAVELLGQLPKETRPSGAQQDVFIGRGEELNTILGASKPPIESRVIIISGRSGVGKTALLKKCRELLPDTSMLASRCHERESVPFKGIDGVIDALAADLRRRSPTELAHLLPEDVTDIAHVFPEFGSLFHYDEDDADDTPPFERRKRAFTRLRQLLTRIARRTPLVITIDDMQWADADTWSLIVHLMRPPHPPPMLMLLCMRPNASTDEQSLHRLDGEVTFLRLMPLERMESEALAIHLLHSIGIKAPELAREIARESEGHPLFIHEIVRYASEHPDLDVRSDLLDEALRARIAQISTQARALLSLLALAGIPMRHAAMVEASGLEFGQYLRIVSQLRADHLVKNTGVDPTDTIALAHNRVREAILLLIYEDSHEPYHLQLADGLEKTGEAEHVPEILAHHLTLGGESARAFPHWLEAATQALDALAFDRAVSMYRSALSTMSDETDEQERQKILLSLAEALVNSGRGGEAGEAFLQVASTTEDPPTRMRCLYLAAEQLLMTGHMKQGRDVLETVLSAIDVRLPKTRLSTVWSFLWNRFRLRIRGLAWTKRSADDIRPEDLLRLDIQHRTSRALGLVEPVAAVVLQCKALRLALDLGEPVRVGWCLALEATFSGSFDMTTLKRARTILEQASDIAQDTDEHPLQAFVYGISGFLDYIEANYHEADAYLSMAEGLYEGVAGYQWERTTNHVLRLLTLRGMGEFHEMRTLRDQYLQEAIDRGDLNTQTTIRRACLLIWLAEDNVAGARRDLENATWLATARSLQLQDWYRIRAIAEIALYEQTDTDALNDALAEVVKVERDSLSRLMLVRTESRFLHGRLLLALKREHRGQLNRLIGQLEREQCRRGDIAAAFLRAGIAAHENNVEDAVRWLEQAATHSSTAGADWMRHVAGFWQGRALGDKKGAFLFDEALSWMRAHRIAAPEKLACFLLPVEPSLLSPH